MCGIVGAFPPRRVDPAFLAHRGPDGSGTVTLPHVTLGHTRLAILDLSGRGIQPRCSQDGNVFIAFNGEIYNFRQISSARESSDTVALLEWLAVQGPGFDAARLDGMYAFAAYFQREDRLVLCRDPAGIKPLYLWIAPDRSGIAFASELKAFFGVDGFSAQPVSSIDVQSDFLQYGYTFARPVAVTIGAREATILLVPTLLDGVYQLAPGQRVTLSTADLPAASRTHLATVRPATLESLRLSVDEQSISDVAVGVQLSGGIDSSLVAHEYAKRHPKFRAFHVSVQYPGLDEDLWVERALQVLKARADVTFHRIVASEAEFRRVLPAVIWHMDEPMVRHPNAAGVYLLCEYVRRQTDVRVLLTGEGADEMLGGYSWHDGKTLEEYDRSRRLFDLGGSPVVRDLLASDTAQPVLHGQLAYDRVAYLPPILARQDRMSMAHSLETRVPFLANRFLAARPPDEPGKVLLKREAERVFGAAFAARPKSGFGFPWPWLEAVPIDRGKLDWLKVRVRPQTHVHRWTLAALGMWAADYLHGGWRSRMLALSGAGPRDGVLNRLPGRTLRR